MSEEQAHQLSITIAALEAQRALLGDAVVDTAVAPLRARLATLEAPEQALRQVSVLFADIVGSTLLSQHLDPEEVHAAMDGALQAFTAAVQAHAGKVLQYAGDSLLAVFGADEAREDDPERAVRAGLAVLEEGRRQAEQVRARHQLDGFDVRVGINTGGVLLGGGVDDEGSIRGITVNIAARMEQTAPPGALRISHDTYRHVRGVFDVQAQPPLHVKGHDEPLITYLVLRAKPRAFKIASRGIEGVETRMVGRAAELAQLQDAFKRLYEPNAGLDIVSVVAEAGVGKSRLLYEFQNWAESRPEPYYLFQGRATPQTQGQPYGLLRDILAWRLQIADADTMDEAKRKVEDGIAPLFSHDDGPDLAQAHAHLLGYLIGLDFSDSKHIQGIKDDGRQIRSRAFHAAAQMFRRVAASNNTPVVLLLEDLHWADDGSLDFLDHLAEVNRDVPMLVLGLTRPTLFERRPEAVGATGLQQRITLEPLDRGASHELANELLKKLGEIPAALRELITGGAEGNPFYMEELVKMLVDEGAIATDTEPWRLDASKLLETKLPPTLTGVLQARLDGLHPPEKLALQQASVVGFVFWDQALAAIDAKSPTALPAVTRRELVTAHSQGAIDGAREYAFKHHILHQVTYDTLLKRHRREYHAKAAAWLAALTGARAGDFLGATAEHYAEAGDTHNACEYFTRAAEHAAGRFAHEALLGYVSRALALAGEDDHATRWRLLAVRERTLDLRGERAEQLADIEALERLAEALGDDKRGAEAVLRRCEFAMRTGDFATGETASQRAMELAQQAGATELVLSAQARWAQVQGRLGKFSTAEALGLQGLAEARAQGLHAAEARFLNMLALNASLRGDVMGILSFTRQSLQINRQVGDSRVEGVDLCNLADALRSLGELAQARQHAQEGLRLLQAIGNRQVQSPTLCTLSDIALRQGDHALALTHARAALDIAVAVQSPENESQAWFRLGEAELALGSYDAAIAAFERSLDMELAASHPEYAIEGSAGLARVAMAQGQAAQALPHAEAILGFIAQLGGLEGISGLAPALTCWRVLRRADDPRAAKTLGLAHGALLTKAATITDATLRHSYMNNLAENRDIVAAWAQR